MIGWLIALGIVLLLLCLLFMPLVLKIDYDDVQDHFYWALCWLGISLVCSTKSGLLQRKKKKKPVPEKDKPQKEKTKQEKQKGKRIWQRTREMIGILPRPLRYLWKGFSVRNLCVGVRVGRFDAKEAALAYGAANALLYAALNLLKTAVRMKPYRAEVQCAFGRDTLEWVVRCQVHFCPMAAMTALWSLAIGFLKQLLQNAHEKRQKSEESITKETTKTPVKETVGSEP